MASDEEPDYMSEEFLTACIPKDVRPGLAFNHRVKRQHEVEQKRKAANEHHKKQHKPVKVLEAELREEGLKTAIETSNKGFAMLQKMGYSAGKGLGKQREGRIEPIAVEIKTDRAGLGREAALKELESRKREMRKKKLNNERTECNVDEFRARMREQANYKLTIGDLVKSQRVCQMLDMQQNISEPAEEWFWPPAEKKDDEEEDDNKKTKNEDEKEEQEHGNKRRKIVAEPLKETEETDDGFEPSEKLELLTNYLRNVHLYCIWCGTTFENETDWQENCPGASRDSH